MYEGIRIRECRVFIFFHQRSEEVSECIDIYGSREWNTDNGTEFFSRGKSEIERYIFFSDDSKLLEWLHFIVGVSDFDTILIYLYTRRWRWVIFHQDIHTSKEKSDNRHEIESLCDTIGDERQNHDNSSNIPWCWVFFFWRKNPRKHKRRDYKKED